MTIYICLCFIQPSIRTVAYCPHLKTLELQMANSDGKDGFSEQRQIVWNAGLKYLMHTIQKRFQCVTIADLVDSHIGASTSYNIADFFTSLQTLQLSRNTRSTSRLYVETATDKTAIDCNLPKTTFNFTASFDPNWLYRFISLDLSVLGTLRKYNNSLFDLRILDNLNNSKIYLPNGIISSLYYNEYNPSSNSGFRFMNSFFDLLVPGQFTTGICNLHLVNINIDSLQLIPINYFNCYGFDDVSRDLRLNSGLMTCNGVPLISNMHIHGCPGKNILLENALKEYGTIVTFHSPASLIKCSKPRCSWETCLECMDAIGVENGTNLDIISCECCLYGIKKLPPFLCCNNLNCRVISCKSCQVSSELPLLDLCRICKHAYCSPYGDGCQGADPVEVFFCEKCHTPICGNCDEMQECDGCNSTICSTCDTMKKCGNPDCNSNITMCTDCSLDFLTNCNSCEEYYCSVCTDFTLCNGCEKFFCSNCDSTIHCLFCNDVDLCTSCHDIAVFTCSHCVIPHCDEMYCVQLCERINSHHYPNVIPGVNDPRLGA